MNDLVPKSRQEVQKAGMAGIGAGAGGIALLLLNGFSTSGMGIGGIILGGIVALGGFAMMRGEQGKDKRPGGIITAVGAVTAAAGLFHFIPKFEPLVGLLRTFLWLPGFGLLGYGIYQAIRFVKGIKSRS